ncbi:MAG: PD-(D/E)XK nuclease family protein [Campylobacteraceae bacterium]|jgi:CRISPR/Cas system-associated exonuclease Cas4 (RecB family)|nr:PD-(D/E)XK nuclease family protein [Campylobacteraceae bacterium]
MIEVFSTARQVREFYESFLDSNQLLTKAITIAEFESKAWIASNAVQADDDTRVLLMREASAFSNFDKLHIPKEFMAFLQNSNYIFRLFEELANEEVEIDKLNLSDTYAEFSEHITILKELLGRYCMLLEQRGLFDKITLPKIAKLNTSYITSFKKIRIHLEGYLSHFEIRLLKNIQKYCKVEIVTPISIYNKKTVQWLREEGIDTSSGTLIECDLNENKIIRSEILYRSKAKIFYKSFSLRVLQAAFVFEKIEEFVKSGVLPQNIVVVLPDESFAPILKELDNLNNLNFAMGFEMKYFGYCQRLQAILKYIKDNEIEHICRFFRLGLEKDSFQDFREKTDLHTIISQLKGIIREDDLKEEKNIIENELFLFEKFLQNEIELNFEQAATLFLKRVEKKSIDDNRGGKVTVMGVLESRGAKYDGVIVVDFNDDIVPRRSNKDMFISSLVRSRSNLPTAEDRENLQRFFYDRLINNAKIVAISCVENEEKLPSRFLKSLHVSTEEISEESYKEILFKASHIKNSIEKSFICEHDFFAEPLSSSRLKTYLECPRKYYLKYIKGYKEAFMPTDICDARSMGTLMHEVLRDLFKNPPRIFTDFKKEAKKLIEVKRAKKALWEIESDIWLLRLESFFVFEMQRFKNGWEIFALEKNKRREFEGFRIEGIIDRIDKKEDKYLLLDYKTGKIAIDATEKKAMESNDFQLEFYSLLCENFGDVKTAFYDLNKAEIVENVYFDKRKERLLEHLHFLKQNTIFAFDKTEDKKICRLCQFSKLCRNCV